MIILDSDVLIEILDRKSVRGREVFDWLKKEDTEVCTTSINLEEVLFGIYKRTGTVELTPDHELLFFPILPFKREEAEVAASLEIIMEKKGKKKPRGDMMIAAIAIENNYKFLTFNKSHFTDIPQLKLVELSI